MSDEELEQLEEVPQREDYVEELIRIIQSNISDQELKEKLDDYHDNDIAEVWDDLSTNERIRLYNILGAEEVSEIFAYLEEDAAPFLAELGVEKAADILEEMDADDAIDILEELDDKQSEILMAQMDDASVRDINLIQSYEEDEVGSKMTTNFIHVYRSLTTKQAMDEVIKQAADHDNISTIYTFRHDNTFYGAVDLKDLITSKKDMPLKDIIQTSYPFVYDHEKMEDVIEELKDYSEDSIPVLSSDKMILGVITSQDLVEAVDDALGEDYANLAGLTAEEDLNEKLLDSMKKRIPWLVILLALGLVVSSVVSMFEKVVATLAIVVAFQSMILGMAGNVGTQSLAVTIRVLIDENVTAKQKLKLVFKESKVGLSNGMILGVISFIVIGFYIMLFRGKTVGFAFLTSGCIGFSLMVTMMISSLMGTIIPLFFHKVGVDPAVASGPLITTVNDMVAVVTYYGLCWILLINLFHLG